MSFKRWCRLSFSLLAGLLASILALVVFVDPFEIYHRALFYTPAYDSKTQLYNNAGIARHHVYDSVIIGSSVTENCMPSDYDEALGGRFVKLCVNGGTAHDHAKMLKMAFDTHALRRVVYGLDLFGCWQYCAIGHEDTPDYLYDGFPLNDAPYWFNWSILTQYIPEAFSRAGAYNENARDWMYVWDAPPTDAAELLALVDLVSPLPEQTGVDSYLFMAQGNLDNNLLPFVRAHRETEFLFFFPPYSLLYWADRARDGLFEACMAEKNLLTQALLSEPNVKLFDFQTAFDWTEDYSLYSDLIHYHSSVNAAIAPLLAGDAYRVDSPERAAQNEQALREAVFALFSERSDP